MHFGPPLTEEQKRSMIKHFCDQCGTELPLDHPSRMAARVDMKSAVGEEAGTFMFEIHIGRNGCWNNGEFCVSCILAFIGQAYGYDIKPKLCVHHSGAGY